MHPDGNFDGVKRSWSDPGTRHALWRLGVMWAMLLVFVFAAFVTRSLTVLLIGVAASVASSVVMRIAGR